MKVQKKLRPFGSSSPEHRTPPVRKRGAVFIITSLMVFPLLSGCSLFSMKPLRIVRWSPAESTILEPQISSITVTFSEVPDETSAELAFSFLENGTSMDGGFSWNGAEMTFHPATPVKKGKNYRIAVSTGAEDRHGNSLSEPFSFSFETHEDHTPPFILKTEPDDGDVLEDPLPQIALLFSEPVDPVSLFEAFSTEPEIPGRMELLEEGSRLVLTPSEPLMRQTGYTVSVAGSVADLNSNLMGAPFESSFFSGTDTVPPELMWAGNEEESCELTPYNPDGTGCIDEGWESRWNPVLRFSEAVDPESLERSLTIDPYHDFTLSPLEPEGAASFLVAGEDPFTYGRIYTLTLDETVKDLQGCSLSGPVSLSFLVNGSRSVPPQVTGVTFLLHPESGSITSLSPYSILDVTGYAPHTGVERGFFDIYLTLAETGSFDLYSFIEAFTLSCTNHCVDILPFGMETEDYTGPAPDPPADISTNEQIVRVHVEIEDDPAGSGVVTLELKVSFEDSLGNRMEEPWLFPLVE